MLPFLLMNKILDEELSLQVSMSIKSKVEKPFENAYKAALLESNLDVGFEAVRKTVKPEDVITKWVPVPSRLSSNKAEVICHVLPSALGPSKSGLQSNAGISLVQVS